MTLRRLRDRPPGIRHRALLRPPEDPQAHQGAHRRGASTRPTASSTRPSSGRPTATCASRRYYERQKALGAEFFETAGWERAVLVRVQRRPAREVRRRRHAPRSTSGTSRWWSPIINAEHLQMRETAGIVDLTAFVDLRHPGPRCARRRAEDLRARRCDVAVGRVVYTPVLVANGGFKSDLTVMRLAHDHFRVVTGGAHGMADLKWFADHLPADGTAQITDLTSALTTIGIWGPNARDDPRVAHPRRRLATRASSSAPARRSRSAPLKVLASRISYVGELGWELYVPMEQGAAAVGRALGGRPAARRCPRRHRRLRHDRPHREGLPRVRHRARDRVHRRRGRHGAAQGQGGRLHRQGGAPQAPQRGPASQRLCTLTVDDHTSSTGVKRYMLGGEPILTTDGSRSPTRTAAARTSPAPARRRRSASTC